MTTRQKGRSRACLKLSFVDVRKAYFNGIFKRKVYLMLPKELGLDSSTVGFLIRCAYGTRDAGAIWEETYAEALMAIGFIRGAASPCCFFHKERDISIVVHGDDLTGLGEGADLDWYEDALAKFFELKLRARIGPEAGDDKEVRILNRILRLDAGGLRYEADPRHVEIITKSLGIENSKTVCLPGVKDYTESDLLGETLDDDMVMVTQLKSDLNLGRGTRSRLCHFDDEPDVSYVEPYGEIYGLKPRPI